MAITQFAEKKFPRSETFTDHEEGEQDMDSWEDLDEETVPLPGKKEAAAATTTTGTSVWGPAPVATADTIPALQFLSAQSNQSPTTKILMRPSGAAAKQSSTPPPVKKSEKEMLADLEEKEKFYAQTREKIFRGK